MKQLLIILVMAVALVFSTLAQAEDITFEWDSNTELDIVGYRLYQSDVPDGQTIGGESSANFIKDIPHVGGGIEGTTITVTLTSDITLYWIVTAYDNGDLESGKSNEVSNYFNVLPPAAPGALQKVNVQAANVYINGDVNVAEANVGTLRVISKLKAESSKKNQDSAAFSFEP